MMARRIPLYDCRRCPLGGVSISTVSRVLNASALIEHGTAQRVREAGYALFSYAGSGVVQMSRSTRRLS
jgi:hypothetical protein